MTSKDKPRIPDDLGLKMGSPSMVFWNEVIAGCEQQLKAAADATTYQSGVLEMARAKLEEAKRLYTSPTID